MEAENNKYKILAVDDDLFSLENLSITLENCGYSADTVYNAEDALKHLDNTRYDLAIVDIKLPDKSGLDIVEYAKKNNLNTGFILITGYSDEEAIIKALRLGVNELLKKPYDEDQLLSTINKLLRSKEEKEAKESFNKSLEIENKLLRREISSFDLSNYKHPIVGKSRSIKKIIENAVKVSRYSLDALIYGETGTGKELVARLIHQSGKRKDAPFIAVNCASLPENLFDSELFGHEKGSFTGAGESRPGLFEVAAGGILFLDEITEMPLSLQAKLLRAVENKAVMRIGSRKQNPVDVQIIAATNVNPEEAMNNKSLRADLFHRLDNFIINIPPLRERTEDIYELLIYYRNYFSAQFNIAPPELTGNLLKICVNEKWPGNVRQLSNFVKKWIIFGNEQTGNQIENLIRTAPENENSEMTFTFSKGNFAEIEEARQWLIKKILRKYNGNKTKTARHLGVSYAGLLKMLKSKLSVK